MFMLIYTARKVHPINKDNFQFLMSGLYSQVWLCSFRPLGRTVNAYQPSSKDQHANKDHVYFFPVLVFC